MPRERETCVFAGPSSSLSRRKKSGNKHTHNQQYSLNSLQRAHFLYHYSTSTLLFRRSFSLFSFFLFFFLSLRISFVIIIDDFPAIVLTWASALFYTPVNWERTRRLLAVDYHLPFSLSLSLSFFSHTPPMNCHTPLALGMTPATTATTATTHRGER